MDKPNPARTTWKLNSYLPPQPESERRDERRERRAEATRAALGERRVSNRRSLRSLLRL